MNERIFTLLELREALLEYVASMHASQVYDLIGYKAAKRLLSELNYQLSLSYKKVS